MKQVTIENVKARIAQLETSEQIGGRLPIRHEFEMACLQMLATALYAREPFYYLRVRVRADHAEWSQATFGNVGPIGPLKHLANEAMEAAAAPGDLSEWADMQFLLWDAQRRAGITDEQITQAMIEKLAVNKAREWPEPKDGEPRLHIKCTHAVCRNGCCNTICPDCLENIHEVREPYSTAYLSSPVLPDEYRAQGVEIMKAKTLQAQERIRAQVSEEDWPFYEQALLGLGDACDAVAKELRENTLPEKFRFHDREPTTDNTAQQFEALATSAQREPVAVVKHYTGNTYPTLKFAQDEWCVCGDRDDAQELADAINALATSAGSGKP